MRERIRFREVLARDGADQAEVFHHAVMEGASNHYSLAQREAWAAALPRSAEAWKARQVLYTTLIAECDGHCVGFCERDEARGRIETLYVWPAIARQGIGSHLLALSVEALHALGHDMILLDASLLLAPGLIVRGWESLGEEIVQRGGEQLKRVRLRYSSGAVVGG